jgi:hypothetical protein
MLRKRLTLEWRFKFKMKRYVAPGLIVLVAICVAGGVSPLIGHHSFAAQYDINQPIKITGTVTKVEWTNPHVRVLVDAADEAGKIIHWTVELTGNMTRLSRDGWKADSIKPGDMVVVNAYRARRIKNLVNANEITKDGKRFLAGGAASAEEAAPIR